MEIYPALKETIEIRYVDFQRPRPELVELLGGENQGCPVLVLASVPKDPPAGLAIENGNGHAFVADPRGIGEYLAHARGIPHPH